MAGRCATGRRARHSCRCILCEDGLTVQVILTDQEVARARALDLSERVRAPMEAAHPYPDGRWLFIPITSRRGAEEVKRILTMKSGQPEDGRAGWHAESWSGCCLPSSARMDELMLEPPGSSPQRTRDGCPQGCSPAPHLPEGHRDGVRCAAGAVQVSRSSRPLGA